MVVMQITSVEQVLRLPSVPYRRRGFLPATAGLYFAVIDDDYVAYVGISETSIRQRWAGHNRKRRVQEMGAVRIAFVESDDIESLRAIERDAIVALDPPLNVHHRPRRIPGASPADDLDDALVGLIKAAEETGLSREWIRKLVHRGEIPGAQRVGNTIGIPQSQVDRLKRDPHKPRAGWPKGKRRPEPPPPASPA